MTSNKCGQTMVKMTKTTTTALEPNSLMNRGRDWCFETRNRSSEHRCLAPLRLSWQSEQDSPPHSDSARGLYRRAGDSVRPSIFGHGV